MPVRSMPVDSEARPTRAPKAEISWTLTPPKYHLDDMILEAETRGQIEDAVSYYRNKDLLFRKWGLGERYRNRQGLTINLYGPPGTGKTMAAHAIAKQLDQMMICVDYAEIESKYVGETAKNLSGLFHKAMDSGALIFFDEADALLSKRVTNMTSATDVSVNQTRSVLLNLLNDFQGTIIFATNFVQNFDPAFLRRIQYHIEFHLPNVKMREKLWRLYIPSALPNDLDFQTIAKKYEGISGSDISNAIFSAAVSAAQHFEKKVPMQRFEAAIERILAVKKANQGDVCVQTRLLTTQQLKEELNKEEEQK